MLDVNCTFCGKDMKMPTSFIKSEKIDVNKLPHVCSDCTGRLGKTLGNKKMEDFMEDVKKEMKKMDKNNEISEKLAEEITNENISSLLEELKDIDDSEENKISESFFRGAWTVLFLMGNNHGSKFLKEEAEYIRDFHKKSREREKDYQKK